MSSDPLLKAIYDLEAESDHPERLRGAIKTTAEYIMEVNQRGNDVEAFAQAILHGSEDHHAWLLESARCWKEGLPLPEVRQ